MPKYHAFSVVTGGVLSTKGELNTIGECGFLCHPRARLGTRDGSCPARFFGAYDQWLNARVLEHIQLATRVSGLARLPTRGGPTPRRGSCQNPSSTSPAAARICQELVFRGLLYCG